MGSPGDPEGILRGPLMAPGMHQATKHEKRELSQLVRAPFSLIFTMNSCIFTYVLEAAFVQRPAECAGRGEDYRRGIQFKDLDDAKIRERV